MRADVGSGSNGSGYAGTEVTKAPSWHGLVAWDVLFNNLSTGLFLVAASCELAAPDRFAAVARSAYSIALFLLLTDLVLLVLDLGDPLRFHHMLRVFKPYSPMSLGTWSLTLYSLLLTLIVAIDIACAIGLLPHDSAVLGGVRTLLLVAGILPALASVSYKGVLFSTSSQPGWEDARWLGGYMINSALVLGCAQMMAVSLLMGHDRAAEVLRHAFELLLVLNLIPLGLLIADVRESLARALSRRQRFLAAAITLGVGTLIPLCLLIFGTGRPVMLAAVLFVLPASLLVRYLIVGIPHALHERAGGRGNTGMHETHDVGSTHRPAEDCR
jgi:Ni/Fe-hydrogenase subunit HybB-like protein